MLRFLYACLLRLHPRQFRQRFADEMLSIFDERGGRAGLFLDGALSLWRQWVLRPAFREKVGAHALDGVPIFYAADTYFPKRVALINGGVLSIFAFAAVCFLLSNWGNHPVWLTGSHHPSRSHLLPVTTTAAPATDLNTEVKVKAEPEDPPIPPYFRRMLVLRVLDADHDGIISATEISNAAGALRRLDRNHDGKLTAEECGVRVELMSLHPVLAVLDANHDGEISAEEIRNAPAALRRLDKDGDGRLTLEEVLPGRK